MKPVSQHETDICPICKRRRIEAAERLAASLQAREQEAHAAIAAIEEREAQYVRERDEARAAAQEAEQERDEARGELKHLVDGDAAHYPDLRAALAQRLGGLGTNWLIQRVEQLLTAEARAEAAEKERDQARHDAEGWIVSGVQHATRANDAEAQVRERDARIGRLEEALGGLVDIINAAGLLPLSNGVELGQTVWYVKASDRLAQAEDALHPAVDPGGKHAK